MALGRALGEPMAKIKNIISPSTLSSRRHARTATCHIAETLMQQLCVQYQHLHVFHPKEFEPVL